MERKYLGLKFYNKLIAGDYFKNILEMSNSLEIQNRFLRNILVDKYMFKVNNNYFDFEQAIFHLAITWQTATKKTITWQTAIKKTITWQTATKKTITWQTATKKTIT